MKTFLIDPQKCTGCHLCEMTCALKNHDVFSLEIGNIKIESDEDRGFHVPTKCMQCEVAYCMKSCVASALYRDEVTGAMLVNRSKCIGCKACIMACPFGSITWVTTEKGSEIHICNLCDGDPECVKVCRDHAISYIDQDKLNRDKRQETRYRLTEESGNA